MQHSVRPSRIHPAAWLTILLAAALLLAGMAGSMCVATADSASSAETENPLQGKKALFVGDSICEAICEQGDPTYGKTMGWAGRILAANGMSGINLGYSGASVSNCRGTNTILNQLKRMAGRKYDYVILHGGTNDAWDSAPVGEMTQGFDGPFDVSTFAGGLEDMISYAKKTYPGAYMGYIINFRFYRTDVGKLSQMDAYVDATIAICEKWEIPYLDLFHDDDFNLKKLKTNTFTNLPDMIHPNSSGYDILTPVIEAWMKTLSAPPAAEDESSSGSPASDASAGPDASSQPTVTSDSTSSAPSGGVPTWVMVLVPVAVVAAAVVVILTWFIQKKKHGS